MIPAEWVYLVAPFAAWVAAGGTKFVVNSARLRRPAWKEIGYGGLPSTHSAIVGAMAALVAAREGMASPAFGVAVALALIVALDARGLRRHVADHAVSLNRLAEGRPGASVLREKIGHSWIEIVAGLAVGAIVALALDAVAG